jgi:hypothetical protein
MEFKPGEKVMIKINGREIETVIDPGGIQRLPCNRALAMLCYRKYTDLHTWLGEGRVSEEEVREIYQNIGYSVRGYAKVFEKDNIENPVWENGIPEGEI